MAKKTLWKDLPLGNMRQVNPDWLLENVEAWVANLLHIPVSEVRLGHRDMTIGDLRKKFAAVELGAKGGKARAKRLTAEQLSEIGKQGAAKRWEEKGGQA